MPTLLETMANYFGQNLFGFQLKDSELDKRAKILKSPIPPNDDDGAIITNLGVQSGAGALSSFLDYGKIINNENELITKYRDMSLHPEVELAIRNIINEMLVEDEEKPSVSIELDNLDAVPKSTQKIIRKEFETILELLKWKRSGYNLIRYWYIDGRMFLNTLIDFNNPTEGIKEVRYVDPRKIKYVKKYLRARDDKTQQLLHTNFEEYFIYNPAGLYSHQVAWKLAKDSVVYVHSGLLDKNGSVILSQLHKALKPLNQLRMLEDSMVIYRLCVTGNSRIKTPDGYKYIKDLNPNDTVYSFDPMGRKIVPVAIKSRMDNGIKPVYQVRSKHISLECTENHPILVFDKEENHAAYIDAKDIIIGRHQFIIPKYTEFEPIQFPEIREKVSFLVDPKAWVNANVPNKEKLIKTVSNMLGIASTKVRNFVYGMQSLPTPLAYGIISNLPMEAELEEKYEGFSRKSIDLPMFVDEDFAKLFGFLLGDGTVSKYTVSFAEGTDKKQNEYYASLLEKYFGPVKKYPCKGRTYTAYRCSNTLAADLMRKMGWISGPHNKRIPSWVFRAHPSIRRAFIEGFSNADGCERITKKGTWFSTIQLCNKSLIEDIKELWTSIGLSSGHITSRKSKGHWLKDHFVNSSDSYVVTISKLPLPNEENILSIKLIGEQEVYDIEIDHELHNFVCNGVPVHNSRAPERRVFTIDVEHVPPGKAQQYVEDIMRRHKNKIVYNPATGEVDAAKRVMTMTDDFYIPMRGGKGTNITTLPGAQNLGQVEDVQMFESKLHRALNVPESRFQSGSSFNLGRASEITRDEIMFQRFIAQLRTQFSDVFLQLLRLQLVLKGIMTIVEWESIADKIRFNYLHDNFFSELKDAEIWQNRMGLLQQVHNYRNVYFTGEWIMENVLHFTDDEIEEMQSQIMQAKKIESWNPFNNGMQGDDPNMPPPGQDFGMPQMGPPDAGPPNDFSGEGEGADPNSPSNLKAKKPLPVMSGFTLPKDKKSLNEDQQRIVKEFRDQKDRESINISEDLQFAKGIVIE